MTRVTELSHRSDARELAPLRNAPTLEVLLQAESETAAWRLVETFSQDGAPFDVELSWSSGGGSGPRALLTVSHATRVCVFARSLVLRVANLADRSNRVGVNVADGFAPTSNVWEYRDVYDGETPVRVPTPPFALRFAVHLADRALYSKTLIEIYDGEGRLRAQFTGSSQPDSGIPIGGAGKIEVQPPEATKLRGVFTLSL